MRQLAVILRHARVAFRGSLPARFVVVIVMAVITGASAGLLPAVIGQALSAITEGAGGPSRPPQGFAGLVGVLMPSGQTWAVVAVTLVATMVTVGIGVMASKLGSTLSGDVTAAVRIELMRAVLGASARDVAEAGHALTGPARPPGMAAPPGAVPPGKTPPGAVPPGKALPGAVPPGKVPPGAVPPGAVPPGKVPPGAVPPGAVPPGKVPPGKVPPGKVPPGKVPPGKVPPGKVPPGKSAPSAADSGAARAAVVKLAVSREAALVSDFAVAVLTGLPQSVTTLAVLGFELVTSDAWVVLVGGAALFVTSRLFADRASRAVGAARRELQNADAAVFGTLQETLTATEDLRLWGARGEAVDEFAHVAWECAAARSRFAGALAVSGQIKSVFTAMSPLLIVLTLQLSGQSYDAGEVAKLLLLVPLLMSRLESLDGMRQGLIEREPLLDAALRLLNLERSPRRAPDARSLDLPAVRGDIRFEDVTYTPPGSTAKVIDGVTLDVPAGSIVGICGPSGSGKSSLLRLLMRLDDPERGTIAVDGVPVAQIEPEQLPDLFGVVRQTSSLLQREVRFNLGVGLSPKPTDEQMRAALERVQLAELAQGEGRGLSTEYRASPPNFSGGECRRLLMCRMLLGPARVLLLDEPEAGLPSGTAEDILRSVVELADGRTHLVVTHAPHLLASDFNVVMDKGRIVAVGTHDELTASSPVYRELLADALKAPAPA